MESPYQYVRELPLREITDIQRTLMEAYLELSYIQKWKDAIKLHLWERIRYKGLSSPNEALILEMVAAEAIAGYTFWLSPPYETNEEDIRKLLVYTLGMLES